MTEARLPSSVAVTTAVPDLQDAALIAPHGLKQIIATFGDVYDYIQPGGRLDPRWQVDYLATVSFPFPISLSWDRSRSVNRMTCHKRMVPVFTSVFDLIMVRGLQPKISTFGGCFAFRPKRTGVKLSAHSWGIAIDLNIVNNPQGSPGDMDTGLIEIFRENGFEWGGDWSGKTHDPDALPVLFRVLRGSMMR